MIKQIVMAVLILCAIVLGWLQYTRIMRDRENTAPLANQVTLKYYGDLDGLFKQLTKQTGVKYAVDPHVANRPFQGAFNNQQLIRVQHIIAEQTSVKFSPPKPGAEGIWVSTK